ncbi:hypothetical protein AJ80_09882 [Polytolypa hystricis UAMH7299]|uniref:Uncharacterized protein n=1 Tax=Polytolypa hystricis (strain UAMH7299) TaxID=1447883 RepID=A0A2B7WHD8_POLH7|nr:hypothetical protein AJ80_09882 [Polytolypa hystricis UAMH7299]
MDPLHASYSTIPASEVARICRPMSLSDEEIEKHIDTRLPYRTGWPKLATLPLVTRFEKNLDSQFPNISKIEASLEEQRLFPILPSEIELVSLWEQGLRDQTIETLDNSHLRWTSLSVFRCGFKEDSLEKCIPTILISAADANADRWWEDILPAIRTLSAPNMEVCLIQGDQFIMDSRTGAESAARRLQVADFSKPEISMGTSCGLAGEKGSGTMGGMVRLEKGGQNFGVFGLSNHHIMMSSGLKAGKDNNIISQSPFLTKVLVSWSADVRSVAVTANNVSMPPTHPSVQLESFIKEEIEGTPDKIGLRVKVEMGEEFKRSVLQNAERTLAKFEQEVSVIQNSNRLAGHLYSTSGYRTANMNGEDWALDWSLTKLDISRRMENTIPSGASPADFMDSQSCLNKYSDVIHGRLKVAKYGRCTGWTEGVVTAIQTVFSDFGSPYGKKVVAWAAGTTLYPNNFAVPGDSGSVVFDADDKSSYKCCWVGLLFAANEGMEIVFFAPMSLVLKDISNVTGCTVVEPVKSG